MSFQDNPIFDANAHRSEESVHVVRGHFSSKAGFLCREETRDFGVDQNVELIDEKNQTSGKIFAIQIKSTRSIKTVSIEGKMYLTFPFKTSRLGYLMRRSPPAYGLIIMYDEHSTKCYFDYAEDVTLRATAEHENEAWKENDSVNIHVPLENELNTEVIQAIHLKYVQRFRSHDQLLTRHGESYGLPVPKRLHQDSPSFTLEYVEENILFLVDAQRSDLIAKALSKFPQVEVSRSKRLTLFGAYAYSDLGQVYEAKYLLMRCKQFESKFDQFEKEIYTLTQNRVAWLAGDISLKEFSERMKMEMINFQNPVNILNIRLNLFYFQVIEHISSDNYEEIFEKELRGFFQELLVLDIKGESKYGMIGQHCDAVYGYISGLMASQVLKRKISKELGLSKNTEEFSRFLDRITSLTQEVNNQLYKVMIYAIENGKPLVKAMAMYQRPRHFIHVHFNLGLMDEAPALNEKITDDYASNQSLLLAAYNIFIEHQHLHEAYLALHHALDIRSLFRYLYNSELSGTEDETLKKQAQIIETEAGIKPYESQIEIGLHQVNMLRTDPQKNMLEMATDDQILLMAKNIQAAQNLPDDRLINIIADLKSYRRFEQVCKNTKLELCHFTSYQSNKTIQYEHLPWYIIRSTITGIQTPPSPNIEELLNVVKYLLGGK